MVLVRVSWLLFCLGCTSMFTGMETEDTMVSHTGSSETPPKDTASDDPWDALRLAIDTSELADLTLMIGTAAGPQFTYSKGDVKETDTLLLASASKWLAAMAILAAVEDGVLALSDHPQDHLAWWTSDPADLRSKITLEQLLSFTSGFTGGPDDVPCVEDDTISIDTCAQTIYAEYFEYEPGTTFVYGPSHLQIAGAMVTAATGDSFNKVFRNYIGAPLGLDVLTGFGLPSLENPRVSGGGTATAVDYGALLTSLIAGDLLAPKSVQLLVQDHTGAGITMAEVPASVGAWGDWHYALGCWRECAEAPYRSICDEPGVLSSPGAFGYYPWWDMSRGVWGVLATQIISADGGARITVPLGQAWSELANTALGFD